MDIKETQFSDTSLNKLLYDLEIVSRLQRGELLGTTSEYITIEESGSLLTSLMRTMNKDSRVRAVMRVRNCVQIVYEMAEHIMESKHMYIYEQAVIRASSGADLDADYNADTQVDASASTRAHAHANSQTDGPTDKEYNSYRRRLDALTRITKTLKSAAGGVQNLALTYAKDTNAVGEAKQILDEIKMKTEVLDSEIDRLERLEDSLQRGYL